MPKGQIPVTLRLIRFLIPLAVLSHGEHVLLDLIKPKAILAMDNLMSEAASLMLVGMGFVFIFLNILVFVTSFMSKLVNQFYPEPIVEPAPDISVSQTNTGSIDDAQLIAVISAAVSQHRSKYKR